MVISLSYKEVTSEKPCSNFFDKIKNKRGASDERIGSKCSNRWIYTKTGHS
jgi:hypothetical protein